MTDVQITEYTDPQCPFAWSAEPARRRIQWLYGEQLSIAPRMVGLHESAEAMEDTGLTPAMLATGAARLSRAHGMPMVTHERRLAGSVPACRAVVATRLHAPQHERAILRALRVRHFAGAALDDERTLRAAARDVAVDPDALSGWLTEPDTDAALRDDMAAARHPTPEALALPDKLASSDEAPSGQRYTCPSWELRREGRTLTVPGFQPLAAYEVAIANLAPQLSRRDDPRDVAEVLDWAGEPLATAEVAAVCAIDTDDAREQLGTVAGERHIGFDGLWSLRA